MFSYYLNLAVRNLRHNLSLTTLMVIAIGAGIGASMTTLAVFRAMSGDPLPAKSQQLYVVQVDNWGPNKPGEQTEDGLQEYLSYIDATALLNAHAAKRQTRIYTFKYGGPWSASDDEAGAPVLVLSRKLNDKLFAGVNSVGRTLDVAGEAYRIAGVLNDWTVAPRFFDLHVGPFANVDEMFEPFNKAIRSQAPSISGTGCLQDRAAGWEGLLQSDCTWIQLWVELPAADVAGYRTLVNNYAAEQTRNGRFHWPAHTQVRDVMQWLKYRHVVPGELGILLLASFGFLFVCLMNAMGLMLAKTIGRTQDISVRRALGASRRAIAMQSLVETSLVGVIGAAVGLAITLLGVWAMRTILSEGYAALTYLDAKVVVIEVLFAVAATIAAGLYPTWRAAWVEPALQLKAE